MEPVPVFTAVVLDETVRFRLALYITVGDSFSLVDDLWYRTVTSSRDGTYTTWMANAGGAACRYDSVIRRWVKTDDDAYTDQSFDENASRVWPVVPGVKSS